MAANLIMLNLRVRVFAWSSGAQAIFGCERAQASGQRLTALSVPADHRAGMPTYQSVPRRRDA